MSTVAIIATAACLSQADITPVEHTLFAHGVRVEPTEGGVSLEFPPFTDIGKLTAAWRLRPNRITATQCTGMDAFFAAMTPLQGSRLHELECTVSDITKIPNGLVALESLRMRGTNVDDFSFLTQLLKLKVLDLTDCCITDADMALVANHTQLSELDVSYTGVSDSGLRSLGTSTSLRSLALIECGVSDSNWHLLVNPVPEHRLKSITLGARLDSGMFKEKRFASSGISKLSHAKLRKSGILVTGKPTPKRDLVVLAPVVDTEGVISEVELDWKAALSASNVVEIDLSDLEISDSHVAQLATIQTLRKISLANTRITDAALESLAKLQDLRELDVSNTLVTDYGFATHWRNPCRLSTLIANDARVIGVGLRFDVFPELQVFSFRRETPRWPLTRLYPTCSRAAMMNLLSLDRLSRLAFSPSHSEWSMYAQLMHRSQTLRSVEVWGITLTSEMRELIDSRVAVEDDSHRGLGE